MTHAILMNTSGNPYEIVDADDYIGLPNVAEAFTVEAHVDGDEDETVEVEVYEVYSDQETPDDYPDGDPHADTLWVPPAGYEYDRKGFLSRSQ